MIINWLKFINQTIFNIGAVCYTQCIQGLQQFTMLKIDTVKVKSLNVQYFISIYPIELLFTGLM